jgi:hypothetical protein
VAATERKRDAQFPRKKYLRELLPHQSLDYTVHKLGEDLKAIRGKHEWNNWIRNYFEAVGTLGTRDETVRDLVISQALAVLKDPLIEPGCRASFLTKFNAACCLCRIHPTSPEVYCDHVINYSWRKNPNNYRLVFGYAVRGFHRRHHEPGEYPPEVFCRKPRCADRQGEVTEQLLCVLEELAKYGELPRGGEHLQINASHALIRWLDTQGRRAKQRLRRVTNLLRSQKTACMAKANLVLALRVNGATMNKFRPLIKKTKYSRGITVDLGKLRDLYPSER